jgi:hypothetical protein
MLTVSPTDRVLILAGAGVSAKSGIPTTAECRQFSISAVACQQRLTFERIMELREVRALAWVGTAVS